MYGIKYEMHILKPKSIISDKHVKFDRYVIAFATLDLYIKFIFPLK